MCFAAAKNVKPAAKNPEWEVLSFCCTHQYGWIFYTSLMARFRMSVRGKWLIEAIMVGNAYEHHGMTWYGDD